MAALETTNVAPADAGFDPARLADLERYLRDLVDDGVYPCMSVLLARGDQVVLDLTYGHADLEEKLLLEPDSVFALYSLTKPLAAAAMLLLHEDGRWQLDDPIDLHLPEFAAVLDRPDNVATRVPTLRETFTHTAGVNPAGTPEEKLLAFLDLNWMTSGSLAEHVQRLAAMGLAFEPGTSWSYSFATDLQVAVVERLSGQRFDLFLQERLFAPLGMVDTGFALSYEQRRRVARGYNLDPESGELRPSLPHQRLESIFPLGGTSFFSTAPDYLRFGRMLLNGGTLGEVTVLRPESVALLFENHLSAELMAQAHAVLHYRFGGGNGHGLNGMVCVAPELAGRPVGRGTYEWGGAFGAFFWADPEHDIVCVGMTSRGRIDEPRPPEVVAQELVYAALRQR